MELGQLRALRELRDRGSIAAVAAALHVTPSSISQQIGALQRDSPVPLTFRDGRRTALTDAGLALAEAAVDVEVALARAEQTVSRLADDDRGRVSVAAFHSVGMAVFGPLIERLGASSVSLSDFDVAQDAFPHLTSEHDIVIAHRLVGSPTWPTTVHVEPLLFEPLDVAIRRDHPLAARETIEPGDLRDEAWVAVHEGFPLAHALTVIAGIAGGEAIVAHRINEFRVAASVVAAGRCVALMPRHTTGLREHPDLVLRPLARLGLGRHVDCLMRPETHERSTVQRVLAAIAAITTGLTDRPPTRESAATS